MEKYLSLWDMLPFLALIVMVWIFGKLIFEEPECDHLEDQEDDLRLQ